MPIDILEVNEDVVRRLIPPRRRHSHKGENGRVLVVGGSNLYHGAPIFSALGAYRAGVDLVYLAVPEKLSTCVRATSPSFIVIPLPDQKLTGGCVNRLVRMIERGTMKVDAAVIGPGLSGDERNIALLSYKLIKGGIKIVLDASALRREVIKRIEGEQAVITPHEGEFYKLFGEKPGEEIGERARLVSRYARDYRLTILLKGPIDVVSDGETIYINRTGTPGMTVGGTGDVLSGLVAGFLAKGLSPINAALVSAFVNGRAGELVTERYGYHFLTEELVEAIPRVLREYDKTAD